MKWRVVAMIVAVLLLLVACVASWVCLDPRFSTREQLVRREIAAVGGRVEYEDIDAPHSVIWLQQQWNALAPAGWQSQLYDFSLCRHAWGVNLSGFDHKMILQGHVIHWDRLHRMEKLWAVDSDFDDEMALQVGKLPRIRSLTLHYSSISDIGVSHFVGLKGLEELYLGGTCVTDNSVPSIAKMKCLESLSLAKTRITGKYFSELLTLRKLKQLNLRNTEADDSAMRVLAIHPTLTDIDVSHTKVTLECVQELNEARPEMTIYF